MNSYLLKLASKQTGRAVMASAEINQLSRAQSVLALDDGSHGGKANWNHDGLVTCVRAETKGEQAPRYRLADVNLPLMAVR